MAPRVPSELLALCGSAARARTLGVLASAGTPLSGYRIGKIGGVPFPKVYRELKRLQRARLLARRSDGWSLIDPEVRRLFQRRLPLVGEDDWLVHVERRRAGDRRVLLRLGSLPAPNFPRNWRPRDPRSYLRDPRKDRILARLGLGGSLHGGPRGG